MVFRSRKHNKNRISELKLGIDERDYEELRNSSLPARMILDGDKKSTITKLSKIENGDKNSLSFLGNPKYNEYLYSSNASIIIVDRNLETKKEINPTLIRVQDPNLAFSQLLEYFESKKEDQMGISKNAEI